MDWYSENFSFFFSAMGKLQNPAKVALRQQLKTVMSNMSSTARITQSKIIANKVASLLEMLNLNLLISWLNYLIIGSAAAVLPWQPKDMHLLEHRTRSQHSSLIAGYVSPKQRSRSNYNFLTYATRWESCWLFKSITINASSDVFLHGIHHH